METCRSLACRGPTPDFPKPDQAFGDSDFILASQPRHAFQVDRFERLRALEDERLDEVVQNGSHLTATQDVVRKHDATRSSCPGAIGRSYT